MLSFLRIEAHFTFKCNHKGENVKKILLLSAVASTMIMAGDSAWDFSGQATAYTQTVDAHGTKDLFSKDTTYASTGFQLGGVNKNLFSGVGVGLEISAIGQAGEFTSIPTGLPGGNNFAFPFIGGGDAQVESGAITQAYLTYGVSNTAFKIGRQRLSKSISPFAYSEGWQVFKNTMDTAKVTNTDIPNTKLIYAAIGKANSSIGRLDNFDRVNQNGNVLHMLTAQNKSIDGLTLTGTYYNAPNYTGMNDAKAATNDWTGDLNILWADAKYKTGDYSFALQGGQVGGVSGTGVKDTTAWGVKATAKLGMINGLVAYSSVNDGTHRITNLATVQNPAPGVGIKSPLYTQMVLNNIGNHQAANSDWLKVSANTKALGGKVIVAYGQAMDNNSPEVGTTGSAFGPNPYEFDLMYKTKVGKNTTLFAAYVLTDRDDTAGTEDSNNFLRFWARYNF